MQILFGADNDGLHISPHDPDGYEWWYFDAVSDDERFVLVVIFFLGTPMSPYYKTVADGKSPLPNDWCGVFVSLHERTHGGYAERAYAYNVYRGGQFAPDGANVTVGGSRFVRDGDTWNLSLEERGLWFGAVRGNLSFVADFLPRHEAVPGDAAHTWVCVAPDCRVSGDITITSGETVRFTGRGYHDHNFGRLPWTDTKEWYWDRIHLKEKRGGAVYYRWNDRYFVGVWNQEGEFHSRCAESGSGATDDKANGYGFRAGLLGITKGTMTQERPLQSAPFYRRFPVRVEAGMPSGTVALGIGEIFRPAGLTGEIMSRALWTRIRRRS